jgi:hypothetical protein
MIKLKTLDDLYQIFTSPDVKRDFLKKHYQKKLDEYANSVKNLETNKSQLEKAKEDLVTKLEQAKKAGGLITELEQVIPDSALVQELKKSNLEQNNFDAWQSLNQALEKANLGGFLLSKIGQKKFAPFSKLTTVSKEFINKATMVDNCTKKVKKDEAMQKIYQKQIDDDSLNLEDLEIFKSTEVLQFLLTKSYLLSGAKDPKFKDAIIKLLDQNIGKLKTNTINISAQHQQNQYVDLSKITGEQLLELQKNKKIFETIKDEYQIPLDQGFERAYTAFCFGMNSEFMRKELMQKLNVEKIDESLVNLWLQIESSLSVDIDYLNLKEFKGLVNKLEHFFYFYRDSSFVISKLFSIYNRAAEVSQLLKELDYSSIDTIKSGLTTLMGIDIKDINFYWNTVNEAAFWQDAMRNDVKKALKLFLSLSQIKTEKPDEYKNIIESQNKESQFTELEKLKGQIVEEKIKIIEELLSSKSEHDKKSIIDFVRKYNLSDEQVFALKKVMPKTKDNLPDINFHFEHLGQKYVFYKLAAGNFQGLFLGYESNSCQSIGNNGGVCAINGFTREDAGFYVLRQGDGKIIGQCYAWLTDNNGLVFDSYEARPEGKKIFVPLLNEFRSKLNKDMKLYVGSGGATPKLSNSNIESRPKAKDNGLKHYGDSKHVYVIDNSDQKLHISEDVDQNFKVTMDGLVNLYDQLSKYQLEDLINIKGASLHLILNRPEILKNETLVKSINGAMGAAIGANSAFEFLVQANDDNFNQFLNFCEQSRYIIQSTIQAIGFFAKDKEFHGHIIPNLRFLKGYGYDVRKYLAKDSGFSSRLTKLTKILSEKKLLEYYGHQDVAKIAGEEKLAEFVIACPKVLENRELTTQFASKLPSDKKYLDLAKKLMKIEPTNRDAVLKVFEGKDLDGIDKFVSDLLQDNSEHGGEMICLIGNHDMLSIDLSGDIKHEEHKYMAG